MSRTHHLLIIEDNEELLSMLEAYFQEKDYTVAIASNGLDAIKQLETNGDKFDAVITDLVMPNISGVGIISIVKKRFSHIPVIAITGCGNHPETLAREAQADLVLEKPFDLSKLEELIHQMLHRHNADA